MSAEAENLSEEAARTAMKNPAHLKRWLLASGRRWLVFDARDLVEALPWPEGAQALAEIVSAYRNYRRSIATGRSETQKQTDHVTGQEVEVEVPIFKDETLEIEELDRAIRYLIGVASEKDPTWRLDAAPL